MMTLAEVTHALGATRVGANVRFTSVSTDSRTLEKDALFVALKGERFDGHDHVGASSARGAVAAMVERLGGGPSDAAGLPLVVVGDTRVALGLLAKHWRSRFRIPAIAVVGSNGKTTVKEMTAAALRAHFGERQILATAGNLNNEIGLPLTTLRLAPGHACAVLELGINHPGETAYLAGIARPTITLVNNAQREHQEFMQNVDQVAAEHAAAIHALPENGVAVLNRDDPYFDYWVGIAGRRAVCSFGIGAAADVRADYQLGATGSELELIAAGARAQLTLQAPGLHNVRNALAAAAAALAAGASLASCIRGLSGFQPTKGRLQLRPGRGGVALIDDSYNANPDSVRAAIDVLALSAPPRVLILGDMGEVGARGEEFHQELGRYAKERGVERVLAIGPLARNAARTFGAGGEHFESIEAAIARAQGLAARKGTMLVKGSRFMRMERMVEHLLAEGSG
jgi:UDP-N-acetylmuramoyl-tripeptide--D-alanyl-D-alanine ligase